MRTIRDKMVKETILLRDAQPGDRIRIGRDARWSEHGYGSVVARKVKDIGRGRVQIKFVQPKLRTGGTVQKHDLPGDVPVERTRKADQRDGIAVIVVDPSRMEIVQ